MNIYTGAKNVIMFFMPLMTMNIYTGAKNVIMFFMPLLTMNVYTGAKNVIMFFIPLIVTWISYCSIIYSARKTFKMVTS